MRRGINDCMIILETSCTPPRVSVAHSGDMEEQEARGSPHFKYV
jgi:hypothetical protein